MRAGWIISAAGHVGLVLFLIFAGAFSRAPLPPVEIAEVTVISEEEFALLLRPEEAPVVSDGPEQPAPPEVADTPPVPRSQEPPEASATPEPAASAERDPGPAAPSEVPAPATDVADAAPLAPAQPDLPADAPEVADPAPQSAPRVAPESAPPPPPEAERAPVVAEAATPQPSPEADEIIEPERAAAPEEAATQTVTEAERPTSPERTPRPRVRPERMARLDPGRTVEAVSTRDPEEVADAPAGTPPEPERDSAAAAPEPEAPVDEDALMAALSEAIGSPAGAPETGAAAGPPLTDGEKDALRIAVQRCWNVGSLSTDALRTTVVVGLRMNRDAKPDTASIRMLGHQGGDAGAAQQAFEAARRAIIRCGSDGFALPPEKYARWAEVEMTFNPEEMRIR